MAWPLCILAGIFYFIYKIPNILLFCVKKIGRNIKKNYHEKKLPSILLWVAGALCVVSFFIFALFFSAGGLPKYWWVNIVAMISLFSSMLFTILGGIFWPEEIQPSPIDIAISKLQSRDYISPDQLQQLNEVVMKHQPSPYRE